MQLQSVSIKGFRSIQDLPELILGSPTVLAGHNDAGKSAIVHAILFLLDSYTLTESDRTYLISADEDVSASADGEVKRVKETYVRGTFGLSETEASEFGTTQLEVRRIVRDGSKPSLEVLRSLPENDLLRDLETLTAAELRDRLSTLELDQTKGTKSEYLERLEAAAGAAPQVSEWVKADTSLGKALPAGRRFDATSAVDAEVAIKETLTTAYRSHLESDAFTGSIRNIEEQLEAELVKDAEEMRLYITEKVRGIGDVQIKPSISFINANGLKSTEITVTNKAGEKINLQLSGAGRARRVALATWEYNATLLADSGEDIVLLYDEPDTHLDYGHQRELMTLIHQQTKNPKVTVVIASHSMNLIDGTDIGDVVHVKHDEQHRTIIERLADDSAVGSHLGAIAASVGLRNTVLLHERLFVGVEGESEARALPVLFRLATGRHLESCGIAIWPCDNNEGARHFAKFLHRHGRNVVFLVDEDSKTNSKHVFSPDKLRSAGLAPDRHCLYVGDPNEIEEIFSDEQWASVANRSWPRVDAESRSWCASDFSEHRDGKFSKNILEMIRNDATTAPTGKPDMLAELALSLKNAEDVPLDLQEKFTELVSRAK